MFGHEVVRFLSLGCVQECEITLGLEMGGRHELGDMYFGEIFPGEGVGEFLQT